MKVLFLGGTRFLGRALVDAALARGDDVTLFNRGRTNPGLFPEVEKLRGDRAGDLDALHGREWDVVVDVAAYDPRLVARSTDALRASTGRYVFVSTVSVYADQSSPPVEGASVHELAPGDEDDTDPATYGARKAAAERIVEDAFGGRSLVVRPGLIVGPHDPTGRFTYWPHRIARGGPTLAPGSPDDPVQFVDVRDLAEFVLDAAGRGVAGTFNATGRPMAFERLLEACRDVTGSDARWTWIPSDVLLAEGLEEWMGVPLWIASPGWEAANRVVVDRAIAAGLAFRPLEETIRATLAEAETVDGVGLHPERERELLARHG